MNYHGTNNGFSLDRIGPPMTMRLIIINVLMWLAQLVGDSRLGLDITNLLGLHYLPSKAFELWQWISYMFLHSTSGLSHLFFNMFGLWMFGSVIERYWGGLRYLGFYIACGITAAISQQLIWHIELRELLSYDIVQLANGQAIPTEILLSRPLLVGASGAVYGLLLAFGMLFPNSRMIIFPLPFPIKAKYLVVIYALIELYQGLNPTVGSNIAHFGHLGGMIGGFLLIYLWRKKGRIDGPYV